MHAALKEARSAMAEGEFPYGAVVIDVTGTVVARAQDRVLRDSDPTAHAEIGAVCAAISRVGPDLSGHALVSNVEPCAMCSTAAWWARVDAVAYGLSQADLFAMRPDSMDEAGLSVAAAQAIFQRQMAIHTDVCRDLASEIWHPVTQ